MAHTNVHMLMGNLTTGESTPTFYIDRVNGRVGVGTDATQHTDGTTYAFDVSGSLYATELHGDGSNLTGLTDSKWVESITNPDDIYYTTGNVGIGGEAGTEKLTVYGDLNLVNGGNIKVDGQNADFSNWTTHTDGIYRSTNVGIGGVPSSTVNLKVYGTIEATYFQGTALTVNISGGLTGDTDYRVPFITGNGSGAQNLVSESGFLYNPGTDTLKATNIRSTGNISIGSVDPGNYKLYVDGQIYASDDITAFSDERMKENVVPIDKALEKVLSIGGYTYNKISEPRRCAGVLAQEVAKVLPEVVFGSEDTNYSVAYGNLVGLLIEAIKDLNHKIEKIENKIHI